MVPFDVAAGRSWMISNSGSVTNLIYSFEFALSLFFWFYQCRKHHSPNNWFYRQSSISASGWSHLCKERKAYWFCKCSRFVWKSKWRKTRNSFLKSLILLPSFHLYIVSDYIFLGNCESRVAQKFFGLLTQAEKLRDEPKECLRRRLCRRLIKMLLFCNC